MYAVYQYLSKVLVPRLHIKEIGVSKRICPDCKRVLDYLGIKYNNRWVTDVRSKHWIDPWDILSKECKPAVQHWSEKDSGNDEDEDEGGGGKYPIGGLSNMVEVS
jgi:hypothetical protein